MCIYKEKVVTGVSGEGLPSACESRANRYKDPEKRACSLTGYKLLKKALAQNNSDINNISFTEDGKPIMPDCFISVSHSGELAVCAVSKTPVGIDAEKLREIPKKDKYRFFSDRENKYVNSGREADKNFIVLWTMKEAYKKATDCKWSQMIKVCFVNEDGALCCEYNNYSFTTEYFEDYVITLCKLKSDL